MTHSPVYSQPFKQPRTVHSFSSHNEKTGEKKGSRLSLNSERVLGWNLAASWGLSVGCAQRDRNVCQESIVQKHTRH